MDGIIIEDPEVDKLFTTAEGLYVNDESIRSQIEDLYTQYLCLEANRDKSKAESLNDGVIIAILESLIASNAGTFAGGGGGGRLKMTSKIQAPRYTGLVRVVAEVLTNVAPEAITPPRWLLDQRMRKKSSHMLLSGV